MRFLARLSIICKADEGINLIELALLIPVFMALVVGAVDFGRAYYLALEVATAAHAGAEYGSLNPSDTTGMTNAAKGAAPNVSNLTVATPTWGCECGDGTLYKASCTTTPTCTGTATNIPPVVHRVQVSASSVYTPLVKWPGIPSSITLTDTATIRGN